MENEKIINIGKTASVDEKLDLILKETQTIKSDVVKMKSDIVELRSDVSSLRSNVVEINTKLDTLDRRVVNLESTTSDIKTLIECELRPNIMRVAEGHFDVLRVCGDIVKNINKNEMISVRTTMLESDVRILKKQINEQ